MLQGSQVMQGSHRHWFLLPTESRNSEHISTHIASNKEQHSWQTLWNLSSITEQDAPSSRFLSHGLPCESGPSHACLSRSSTPYFGQPMLNPSKCRPRLLHSRATVEGWPTQVETLETRQNVGKHANLSRLLSTSCPEHAGCKSASEEGACSPGTHMLQKCK